jgi:hypothetical protein
MNDWKLEAKSYHGFPCSSNFTLQDHIPSTPGDALSIVLSIYFLSYFIVPKNEVHGNTIREHYSTTIKTKILTSFKNESA